MAPTPPARPVVFSFQSFRGTLHGRLQIEAQTFSFVATRVPTGWVSCVAPGTHDDPLVILETGYGCEASTLRDLGPALFEVAERSLPFSTEVLQ